MSNQYCRGKVRSPTAMCALCAVSAVVPSPEDGVAGMVSGDGGAGRPGATGPAGIALYAVRAPRRRERPLHRHATQGVHPMAAQPRAVERVIQPTPVIEGAGVRLRRSIATATLDYLDPFLLLDNFQSDDPDDYLAGQHVGDGLDAAVGVPGETGEVVVRIVRLEVVEQKERVEVVERRCGDAASQADAGALDDGRRLDHAFDDARLGGHVVRSLSRVPMWEWFPVCLLYTSPSPRD